MKISHKINHGWMPPASPLLSDSISDGYAAEIATTLRRAEKAWRKSQRALKTAEWRAGRRPSPQARQTVDQLRAEVERRFAELLELERQMQLIPRMSGTNRSGERRSPRSITPKGTQL